MKRNLILLCMSLIALSTHAYKPLVEEGKKWTVINRDAWLDADQTVVYKTSEQWIDGEQEVNGVMYKRLYENSSEENKLVALVREEGQKVYALIDGKEYLMYDFDLKLYDYFDLNLPNICHIGDEKEIKMTYVVTKRETVDFAISNFKSIELVKLTLTEKNEQRHSFVIYEGIGSANGWIDHFNTNVDIDGGGTDYVRCVDFKDYIIRIELFKNDNVELNDYQCTLNATVKTDVEDIQALSENLYYNGEMQALEMEIEGEKQIAVYDVQGKRVFNTTTVETSVPFCTNSGLYIVSVTTKDNRYSGIIMVK